MLRNLNKHAAHSPVADWILKSYATRRLAESAAFASPCKNSKNAGVWPMKRPMSVRNLTTPIAASSVLVGRMTEHEGSKRLRNGHGSGMIRLVWNVCVSNGGELRSGNTNPLVGSVSGGAFPALSCQ